VADPSTTPVSPFNPATVQVPRDGPGCSKPLLIGCGLLLLLLVVGVVVIRIEAPAFVRWTFRLTETSLTPRLPPDTTPAERQRLHQAFEAAGRALDSEQTDLASLQRVQREIMALSGSTAPLTHQQVRELTEALEALVHKRGAPGAAPGPGQPAAPPGAGGTAPAPGPGSGQPPRQPSGAGPLPPAPPGSIALAAPPR
jgi:hypothetical protein